MLIARRLRAIKETMSSWSIVKAAQSGGQRAHRVAVQGFERAKMSGAKLARQVIRVQQDSGLPRRMMLESANSVGMREMGRYSDMSWQAAYMKDAEAGLFGPATNPRLAGGMPPAGPDGPDPDRPHPSWPFRAGVVHDEASAKATRIEARNRELGISPAQAQPLTPPVWSKPAMADTEAGQ